MSRTAILSDEDWALIEPLLPVSKVSRGPDFWDDRQVVEGIAFRYRTGMGGYRDASWVVRRCERSGPVAGKAVRRGATRRGHSPPAGSQAASALGAQALEAT